MIRNREMKVMLTLFHHSIPKWAVPWGGWTSKKTVHAFADFVKCVSTDSSRRFSVLTAILIIVRVFESDSQPG